MPRLTLDLDALFAPASLAKIVGLAVSGGPDSLALMLLAAEWAKAPGRPKLIVYSVDHGLRSEAADEVAMVRGEATKLGLAVRGLRWEGGKPATGIQAAARSARYRLIASAMAADGAELLLTAHHLDDQAETVLMRLARGSGIEGLRGMDVLSVVEGCKILRPLLGVRREVLVEIVRAAGLTPAHDPSNEDTSYERVRWRKLMPQLEEMGLTAERLGVFAQRMSDATSLIAEAVEDAWVELVELSADGSAMAPQGKVAALTRQVGVALIGQMLELVSGDRRPPPLGPLESLFDSLQSPFPTKATTLHGCLISSDGRRFMVRKEGPRTAVLKSQLAVRPN